MVLNFHHNFLKLLLKEDMILGKAKGTSFVVVMLSRTSAILRELNEKV